MTNHTDGVAGSFPKDTDMEKGSSASRRREDGKVCLVKWKDKKYVLLLSSAFGIKPEGSCKRTKSRTGKTSIKKNQQIVPLPVNDVRYGRTGHFPEHVKRENQIKCRLPGCPGKFRFHLSTHLENLINILRNYFSGLKRLEKVNCPRQEVCECPNLWHLKQRRGFGKHGRTLQLRYPALIEVDSEVVNKSGSEITPLQELRDLCGVTIKGEFKKVLARRNDFVCIAELVTISRSPERKRFTE
ncbi:piggyBac transposable element-derived protein 3 [Trichonephila clavipes]|nr:piggyBac transposable element-derived protein 3 [Trichonephila clavipes]